MRSNTCSLPLQVYATQFHPEKSGPAGLYVLRNFLSPRGSGQQQQRELQQPLRQQQSSEVEWYFAVAWVLPEYPWSPTVALYQLFAAQSHLGLCLCALSDGNSAQLAKRVVVALDVRSNDAGDLVVTKGLHSSLRQTRWQRRNPAKQSLHPCR